MKGYIRKRSKGSWTIVIDVGRDHETGKRCQQWHTIKGTKRDAEKRLAELLVSIEKGSYVRPKHLTLGEWLKTWIDTMESRLAPKTAESYRVIVERHLIPALGKLPLTQLQPQHIQSYYAATPSARSSGEQQCATSACTTSVTPTPRLCWRLVFIPRLFRRDWGTRRSPPP